MNIWKENHKKPLRRKKTATNELAKKLLITFTFVSWFHLDTVGKCNKLNI